jgi:eukaryotic-like serine/threonine-protein kinase
VTSDAGFGGKDAPVGACPEPRTLALLRDSELDGDESAMVERHIASCAKCAVAARAMSTSTGPKPQSTLPPPAPLERGALIGRYVVLERLGEGTMGEVYSAYDPQLDRRIAVKLLRRHHRKTEQATRMQREGQALARLSHPNVVTIYDVGWLDDARMFLAMELVVGTTLRDSLRKVGAAASWRTVLKFYLAAGRGLAAAHAVGLIHRDFKPENVLVGNDGSVKVTDFGLVHTLEEDGRPVATLDPARAAPASSALDTLLTNDGDIMGTPAYMAPEQFLGEPTDARCDEFSFCVALYEALYGVRPFPGRGFNAIFQAVVEGHVADAPSSARVPAWVRRVVLRGLSRDPADRYPTLDELLDALAHDPERAGRRLAIGVAIAAGASLAAILGIQYARHRSPVCSGAQASMEEVWNPATKGSLLAAFRGSGTAFGADTWQKTEPVLDGYARAWVTAHRQTCEATRVRSEQSEEVMTVRMACLAQRRESLRAITSVFGKADRQIVEKAVEASRALPAVADCEDVTSLMTVAPPPADAGRRASIERLGRELAAAKALVDAGGFKQSMAIAPRLADEIRGVGYAPLTAEALLVLGQAQDRSAKKADAAASLREAVYAAEAGRADDTKVRALVQLTTTLADQNRIDEAREASRFADAASQRLTDPEAYHAERYAALAWVAVRESKFEEGVGAFRQAIALAERRGNDLLVARLYSRTASALGKMGKTQEAVELLDRADATFVSALGPDHPARVSVQVNKAAIAIESLRFAEGLAAADAGLDIAARTLAAESMSFANLHNNRAQALLELGRLDEALAAASRAEEQGAKVFGATNASACMYGLNAAATLARMGRRAEAIAAFQRVLAVFDASLVADHEWTSEALAELGIVEVDAERPRDALGHLERALAAFEKVHDPTPLTRRRRARTELALAKALGSSGPRTARAVELAARARATFVDLGDEARTRAVDAWLASPK